MEATELGPASIHIPVHRNKDRKLDRLLLMGTINQGQVRVLLGSGQHDFRGAPFGEKNEKKTSNVQAWELGLGLLPHSACAISAAAINYWECLPDKP